MFNMISFKGNIGVGNSPTGFISYVGLVYFTQVLNFFQENVNPQMATAVSLKAQNEVLENSSSVIPRSWLIFNMHNKMRVVSVMFLT